MQTYNIIVLGVIPFGTKTSTTNFACLKMTASKEKIQPFLAVLAHVLFVSMVGWAQPAIEREMLYDTSSFYYLDAGRYPQRDAALPIGVFDSGTGGLTVFNAIATFDEHHNRDGAAGADGLPDFATEDFIYLADQANMPYGHYSSVGKTEFLRELILKDAQFLLGRHYYGTEAQAATDKRQIKALVIACNTATAYGKSDIEALLQKAHIDIPVVGVIDAGAEGALSLFGPSENGSIGVFATAGTVASGGYARAIERLKGAMGLKGDIAVFNQGGVGLAEAIDEDLSYIDTKATSVRDNYKGPNVSPQTSLAIDKTLLKIYNFDFSDYKMLCDAKKADDCGNLQINSAENYVRYHLVSMLEHMRQTPGAKPLKVLILGCTHYPYMTQVIEQVLIELRNYREGRKYRYRHLLMPKIALIDPSVNTARELYEHLVGRKLQNPSGSLTNNSEFYISVPNPTAPGVGLEQDGARFTYAYKYGRNPNEHIEHVRVTPFTRRNVSDSVAERLRQQIPAVYALIQNFGRQNPKMRSVQVGEKI